MSGKIVAVCISPTKGTPKKPVTQGLLKENFGLENDAHAGDWHRQISLLAYEKIQDFNQRGGQVTYGDFGENIIVANFNLAALEVGSLIRISSALLKITQKGKECHSRCAIYDRVGDCIMPREGLFARVLTGGYIQKNDLIFIEEQI
ncbi:MAG: MOSC domain-containing protein [Candidatus Adiutrix intracellularis]|jgi:MOSC domain-containing protein YiiM|nr:MOSC domain-containing protein [Candidatus Adiutrix intracellularis]